MYILNITTNIANDIESQWLKWMQNTFIPAMLATKKFNKALLTKVQIEEEMGGITYSTQYFALDKKDIEAYYKENQNDILAKHSKFRGMYVDFSTELEVVNQFFENAN